jgi:hypothetical protein
LEVVFQFQPFKSPPDETLDIREQIGFALAILFQYNPQNCEQNKMVTIHHTEFGDKMYNDSYVYYWCRAMFQVCMFSCVGRYSHNST